MKRVAWNKGKKLGFTPKGAFKKGVIPWHAGKKIDKEKYPNYGHHQKHSEETKRKWSERRKGKMMGEKNPSWKGGITPINTKIRNSTEFAIWRKAVFERDGYTCIWCSAKSGIGKSVILHADHIKPFALFPELRLAIDNGRTLCISCHRKTDTFAGRTRI